MPRMPTMLSESAGGLGANSASARSVRKSSACRLEHQALSCESPSVLHPCRDQDRPYQLRLGIVMQAYRKNTKHQVGLGQRGDKRRTIRTQDGTVKDHVTGKVWRYEEYA